METSSNYIMHRLVILVPFRNVGKYLVECVNSIVNQRYDNYIVYLLDDSSTDGAVNSINNEFMNVVKIIRKKRLGALRNIYEALISLPIDNEDIVLIVDGDDYLFGQFALQIVNKNYNNNNNSSILLTYGQFVDSYGFIRCWSQYSEAEVSAIRSSAWKASHLKTFKYKLFKEFLRQDPNVDNFRYNNGTFYDYTYDQAIMFPLIEIAGFNNICKIYNIIYCYRLHANNDHVTIKGRNGQIRAEKHIRDRPSLKRVFK